jgi:hypothetical protein
MKKSTLALIFLSITNFVSSMDEFPNDPLEEQRIVKIPKNFLAPTPGFFYLQATNEKRKEKGKNLPSNSLANRKSTRNTEPRTTTKSPEARG